MRQSLHQPDSKTAASRSDQVSVDRATRQLAPDPAQPIQAKPLFRGLSQELPLIQSGGQKLPEAVQQKMEAAFHADFSEVRIHAGDAADQLDADAFTMGNHIGVPPSDAKFDTPNRKRTLGHELAHVIQQRARRVPAQPGINTDPKLEAEADRMGAKAAAGESVSMAGASCGTAAPAAQTAPVQLAKKKKLTDKDLDRNGQNINNIASGAINSVDLVTYKHPIGSRSQTGFFKPDLVGGEEFADVAKDIGIQEDDPRWANRAIATSRIAALLRDQQGNGPGSVIAETIFARHNQQEGTVSERATGRPLKESVTTRVTAPYIIQELTGKDYTNPTVRKEVFTGLGKKYRPGDSSKKLHVSQKQNPQGADEFEEANGFYSIQDYEYYHQFDFTHPETQKGLADLQLLDAITGQVDRHGSNIFIDPTTGRVTGIDHDVAFGSQRSDNPSSLKNLRASHNRGLPPIVDETTAEMVLALDWKKVEKELKNLLSQEEMDATNRRLQVVKQHIRNLYAIGRVVGAPLYMGGRYPVQQPLQWGTHTYNTVVQPGAVVRPEDSYLAHAVDRYTAEASRGPRYAEGATVPQPVANPPLNAVNPPQPIANPPQRPLPVLPQRRQPPIANPGSNSAPPQKPLPVPPQRRRKPLPIPPQRRQPPIANPGSNSAPPQKPLPVPPQRRQLPSLPVSNINSPGKPLPTPPDRRKPPIDPSIHTSVNPLQVPSAEEFAVPPQPTFDGILSGSHQGYVYRFRGDASNIASSGLRNGYVYRTLKTSRSPLTDQTFVAPQSAKPQPIVKEGLETMNPLSAEWAALIEEHKRAK